MSVLVLFIVVFGGVALYARRRPMLARLAWRESSRRKGQTALVIGGLMVGTATITAALVAADSVGDSVVEAFAYRNWGHVDLTVTSTNRVFPRTVAERLASDPQVQRATDGVAASLELPGSAADLDSRQGSSGVIIVGFDPAQQRPFGEYVTLDGRRSVGDDLQSHEVFISRVLADNLDAKTGDSLRLSLESSTAHPEPVTLTIAGIVRIEGPGGYTLGSAVFGRLETIQRVAGTDQINIVRISAPGGIRNDFAVSARSAAVVERAVERVDAGVPLSVSRAKEREADNAETGTQFIRTFLLAMSFLVMAAGAALIVNIVSMLAEERRSHLGVLRALGLKRRSLVGLSIIEGAIYSVLAGLVGTGVGVVAGRVIANQFARAFAEFAGEDFDFSFVFSIKPSTLVAAFAFGSVLTLGVIALAARRTSRMTITAAIRNLPEPPATKTRRRKLRMAMLIVFGAFGAAGIVASDPFARMVGGLALIIVLSVGLRPRMAPRVHASLTGFALAAWSFAMIAGINPDTYDNFFFVFIIAMLAAVFGLTILASANLHIAETVVGLLGRAFAGLRAILRPPLAYLARRSVRTGLTTGVFAVVIGILSLFAVFYVIFQPDYNDFGNGYDVRVLSTGTTNVEIPAAVQTDLTRALEIPTRGYIGPFRSCGKATRSDPCPKGEGGQFGDSERIFIPLFEMKDLSPADPPVPLDTRDKKYKTDRAVWEAVRTNPRIVVTNFGLAGQKVRIQGTSGPIIYTVAGVQSFGLLDGVWGTPTTFAPIGDTPVGVSMLLDLKNQDDARRVARTVESSLFNQGVEADAVSKLLEDSARAFRTFFSSIDILMRMGLVIGIFALGIVALRVIIERRHVIGVMRALGYKRRAVMAGLMTEATVTATIGALTGSTVGITMGYIFYRQGDSEGGFGISWASFGGVLALVYVAVLLVTLGPAWRASRLPPAEAVRYTE